MRKIFMKNYQRNAQLVQVNFVLNKGLPNILIMPMSYCTNVIFAVIQPTLQKTIAGILSNTMQCSNVMTAHITLNIKVA
jgi:hypothetical protein